MLADRIKQHIPMKLRRSGANQQQIERSESAITCHLKLSPACIPPDPEASFDILMKVRNRQQLDVLEALFIRALEPEPCKKSDIHPYVTIDLTCYPCYYW